MKLISRTHTRRIRHDLLYSCAYAGYHVARIIPRSAGLALFGTLGRIVYHFRGIERHRTVEHLKFVYGQEWSEEKIQATAHDVYGHLGKNLFDSIYLSKLDRRGLARSVTCDPIDELRDEYNKGKGVVTITSHSGCFEMLLHYFPAQGLKCFAIGRKMFDPRLESLVRQTRAGSDIEYLDRSEGARKMLRLLNDGRLFGVLIDQDTNVEGVYADFMGHQAFTPSGPVKLAMKFDVPLFVITTARLPDDRHHIFISKKVHLQATDNSESDIVENVTRINALICTTIRQFPSQWVWMHRRWHHQAPSTTQSYRGEPENVGK